MNSAAAEPMAERTGRVVAVADGYAWIETARDSACGGCATADVCGTGALSKAFGARPARLRIADTFAARTGERVVVGLPQGHVVGAALLAYLLPIAALIAAAALASALGLGEAVAGLAGFSALAATLLFSARRADGRAAAYAPTFLRRADAVVCPPSPTPFGDTRP